MNTKTVEQKSKFDLVLWLVVFILIAAGVVANYYYSSMAVGIRVSAWILLACVIIAIALQTAKGKVALGFIKEARIELRKVVWPKRQETMQTTLIVVALVLLMALIMWGADSLLLWLIGLLTGQRG